MINKNPLNSNKMILFFILYFIIGVLALVASQTISSSQFTTLLACAYFAPLLLFFAFYFATIRSITREYQAFVEVFNKAPMGIVIRSCTGENIKVNRPFEETFNPSGVKYSAVMRKSYSNQWDHAFSQIEQELKAGESVVEKEFRFMDNRGQDFYTTLSFKLSENSYCTIALNTKDEFIQKAELKEITVEALKVTQAKSSFLSTMSHKIRTPLTSILGFLGLLSESELNDKQVDYVRFARNSASKLLFLVNDILDYSKILQEDFRLEIQHFSISSLVNDLVESISVQIEEADIELITEIDPQIFDGVEADQVRIGQVLMNLISTSLSYTTEGYIKLKLEEVYSTNTTQDIRFTVSDTGHGLSEEELRRIFENYESFSNSEIEDNGLHLAITQQLVNIMDGRIEVHSSVGKGTEFSFVLRLKKAPSVISGTVREVSQQQREEFKDKIVLVVDDEESNCQLVKLYMKSFGVACDFARDGKEAVDIIVTERKRYDLILMDINMPEMNGLDAFKAIRKHQEESQLPLTPTYAFTAHVYRDHIKQFVDQGFTGHFLKPFKKNDIFLFLKKHL